MIIFENIAKPLLIFHMLSALALVAASTLNLFAVIQFIRGKFEKSIQEKSLVTITFISYLICFVIGGVLYPTFRYYVRALYFDTNLRWATGIFEIKEHWLSLGLILSFSAFMLRRYIDPEKDRSMAPLYYFLITVLWIIVMFSTVTGFILKSNKSI